MDMKLMKGNMKSNSLPIDLMIEILKRLPVKPLIRFLSVSKLLASIIRSRDFKKLFLDASLTRPRGFLVLLRHGYCCLDFSSNVLSQNRYEPSSLTTFHVSCHTAHTPKWSTIAPSVHGLICYSDSTKLMIYNPCTRRSITLPEIDTWRRPIHYYLGHDPIDNDYTVLCTMIGGKYDLVEEIRVLTVGTGNSWKMIENNIIPHSPFGREMCINGVLYYQAFNRAFNCTKMNDFVIICFDVRSEKLYPIKGPCNFRCDNSSKLISYEGKLAVNFFVGESSIVTLCVNVLEDVAKEEWSRKTFVLPTSVPPIHWPRKLIRTTETDTGEIILAPTHLHAPVHELISYDMKTKSAKTVYIRGNTESTGYIESVSYNPVENLCSNLVENLMFL